MLSGGCPQVEQGWEDATLWAHTGRQALKATGFVASCSWGAVAGLLICTSLLLGNFLSLSPPISRPGGSRMWLGSIRLSCPGHANIREGTGSRGLAVCSGHGAWSWHIPQLSTGLWLCLMRFSQVQQHLMGSGQDLSHSERAVAPGCCKVQGQCCSTGLPASRNCQDRCDARNIIFLCHS